MSDWNIAKWDWEILDMLTSKATQIPPHNQYPIILEGYCDIIHQNTSFNSSMPSSSAADFGNNACISTKTSISASTASTSNGTPPMLNASLGFNESLACLKLGKPTYSDNTTTSNIIAYNNNTISSSSSEIPLLLSTDTKKRKSYCQSTSPPNPLCQVEGCSLDLSSAKAYHRKHRVCETHSKSSKVIIRGLERRFCQQCSRFHNLSEFDQKKRSCRRRLSDHNARRRKPYHETIQFNSTRQYCSSSFYYDERQEMSFMLSSNTRVSQITSAWESRCGSNYALITRGRGYIVKPAAHDHKTTLPDPHSHLPTAIDQLPRVIINHETNHLFPYTTDSICQAAAAADDVDRALSLLSTNTWGTYVGPHII